MPGDYSEAELASMSSEEFRTAKEAGWKKPRPDRGEVQLGPRLPQEQIEQRYRGAIGIPEPQDDVWARNRAGGDTEEFVVPSGQRCRLRRPTPEMLLPTGILDRVTRLDGLADQLVAKAEGAPPTQAKMPSREELQLLLDTLNLLIPIVVAEPKVYADGDDSAPEDAIRVSDIDLADRVAIMERSLAGLAKLDRFRHSR